MDSDRLLTLARSTAVRMNVPPFLLPDAAAEGALAGVKAWRSYQPEKGAALESWVITHMRWAIFHFVNNERRQPPTLAEPPEQVSPEARHSITDILDALRKLPEPTRAVLSATMMGFPNKDICRDFHLNAAQLAAVRQEGRTLLEEALR